MSERKPVLLYFYPGLSSFVVKDLQLMEQQYEVRHMGFLPSKKWKTPFTWFGQLLFLLRHIWEADILVCMFAGYHSFFPALFGKTGQKPTLIMAGGTDCVSFPSINYGCFSKPVLGTFTKWSYHLAAHIAPVHEKLVWQEYTYQPNDYPYQGFRYHCPGLKTPHTVVYNGYNPTAWLPASGVTRKPKSFLTVCAGLHMRFTQKLKGIDLILEAARQLPDAVFTIVGAPEGYRFPDQPENLTLLPLMPLADLRAVYSAHFFYLQLSLSEGFPNALSESMLCGCVPIVSHVAGMPDIVGDSGYVLPKKDPTLLAQLLKKAIADAKAIDGLKCRERIATHFPAIKREQALLQLLHTLRK